MARGWLHTVATDHCPFWVADRHAGMQGRPEGWRDFTEIPGGLPGIETRLALIWDGVQRGKLSALRLGAAVRRGAGPAVRAVAAEGLAAGGRRRRRGGVGPAAHRRASTPTRLHMATDHSPYEGMTATGWPSLVTVRGQVVAARRPLRRRAGLRPLRRAGPDHRGTEPGGGGGSAEGGDHQVVERSRARRA